MPGRDRSQCYGGSLCSQDNGRFPPSVRRDAQLAACGKRGLAERTPSERGVVPFGLREGAILVRVSVGRQARRSLHLLLCSAKSRYSPLPLRRQACRSVSGRMHGWSVERPSKMRQLSFGDSHQSPRLINSGLGFLPHQSPHSETGPSTFPGVDFGEDIAAKRGSPPRCGVRRADGSASKVRLVPPHPHWRLDRRP